MAAEPPKDSIEFSRSLPSNLKIALYVGDTLTPRRGGLKAVPNRTSLQLGAGGRIPLLPVSKGVCPEPGGRPAIHSHPASIEHSGNCQ